MMDNLHIEDSLIIPPPINNIEEWVNIPTTKTFRGIGGVKAANETQMVSPEQAKYYVEELRRCKNDVIHFAENWFYIISYRGKEKIKLFPKQKEIITNFVNYPFNIVLSGRQQGKCCSFSTQIVIRHKKTKHIKNIEIGEFYKKHFNCPRIQVPLEVKHKIVEQRCVSKYEVLTDTGWEDIKGIAKTIPFKVQTIYTNNYELDCADEHIVFDKNWNEVFVKDLKLNDLIQTENGAEQIVAIDRRDCNPIESMYDLMLDEKTNNRYITNGIISHNSTMYTIFSLHYCLFNKDKKVLMVANKEGTVKELLQRIKMAITMLPDFLKLGITTWSAKKIEFENGSSIMISATSPDAARGSSCDVCLDENTWIIIKEDDVIKQVPISYLFNKVPLVKQYENFNFNELLSQSLLEPVSNDYFILNNEKLKNSKNRHQLDFHMEYKVFDIPVCPICGKKLYNRFKNGHYYSTCSSACSRRLSKYLNDLNPEYTGIKILTPNGFEKFDGLSSTLVDEIYTINLSNGHNIKCSASHKFNTARGLVKASELHFNDKLISVTGNYINVNSILKTKKKQYLYDIINSGKDHMFLSNNVFSHNCIIDEAAFVPTGVMDEFVASVFPTISSKPEGKIIAVSTPNGVGNWFERTYHKALYSINGNKSDDLQWKETTFPWYDHPERDEKWRKKQIAMLSGDERKFNQEFACCFLGSSSTLFDTSVLEYYKKYTQNAEEPVIKEINKNKVKIWKDPIPDHAYILGVDIADGSGSDSSVIQIFDVTDVTKIEQVASFASREIDTNSLALLTAILGGRYNCALISGERNGIGAGYFDVLTNVFEYDNTVNYKNREEMADRPGIYSTNSNKIDACLWAKSLMSLSVNCPEIAHITIKENNTAYEMEYFESKTLNRTVSYSASKNNHDDYIMSFIWVLFALKMEIVENYFNIRHSRFTPNGIEIPKVILPLPDVTYSEEFINNKINGSISINDYNKQSDSQARSMLQDIIYNSVMDSDEELF